MSFMKNHRRGEKIAEERRAIKLVTGIQSTPILSFI